MNIADAVDVAREFSVPLRVVRDVDEPVCTELLRKEYAKRVAFLNRVCGLGELTFRRDAWPIRELGIAVAETAEWLVRVRIVSIDRDTLKIGQAQSTHNVGLGTVRSGRLPLAVATALHEGVMEHFAHEVAEAIYFKGERLLDPHKDDP